jgi:hypothetical protein
MNSREIYEQRQEAFYRRTLWSSGFSILMAAASRLPTWEVSSPVSWLVGTVNVSFLSVFGPILILGATCFTYLSLLDLEAAKRTLTRLGETDAGDAVGIIIAPSGGVGGHETRAQAWAFQLATSVQRVWVFAVPVLAYAILLASYFDFVRPATAPAAGKDHRCLASEYPGRTAQIADMLLGLGGWSGFQPCTPSIRDALIGRAEQAKAEDRQRLQALADLAPWIYPPWQTWLYLAGFGGTILLAVTGWTSYCIPARGRGAGRR